jgi:hypothetical protein
MVRRGGQLAVVESNVEFDKRKASALIEFWVNGEEVAVFSEDEEDDRLREVDDVGYAQKVGKQNIREAEHHETTGSDGQSVHDGHEGDERTGQNVHEDF